MNVQSRSFAEHHCDFRNQGIGVVLSKGAYEVHFPYHRDEYLWDYYLISKVTVMFFEIGRSLDTSKGGDISRVNILGTLT